MNDQASNLRTIVKKANRKNTVRAIAISSGKGGVGKTSISTNLAIALAQMQKRVLILDADMGLANIDVLLGIRPVYNMRHVLNGEKNIKEIVVDGPAGIKIIPSATGVQSLTELDQSQRKMIIDGFSEFDGAVDFLLIDTGAGISKNVTEFVIATGEVIVVTMHEPTAITDAYALIKVLHGVAPDLKVHLFVNQVKNTDEAQEVEAALKMIAEKFLGKKISGIGFMQKDPFVIDAVRKQEPFVLLNPRCQATTCIKLLANRICAGNAQENNTSFAQFAEKLTGTGKK